MFEQGVVYIVTDAAPRITIAEPLRPPKPGDQQAGFEE
jgi:hypothetical protein